MSYKEFSQRIDGREERIKFALNRLNRVRKEPLTNDNLQALLRGQTKMLFRRIDEIVYDKISSDWELRNATTLKTGGLEIDFGLSRLERIDRLVDLEFYGFAHLESTLPDVFPWKSTRYQITSKEAGIKLILRRSINDAPDFRGQTEDTRISAMLKTRHYKNIFKGEHKLETQNYHVLSAAMSYASECLNLLK